MEKITVLPGGRAAARQFEALVRPHYDTLYRVAYRLTRTVHDAEDLVQEACIRAYPHLEKLAGLEDPRGWLLNVMRNLFIDLTRRYEQSHVSSLETAVDAPLHDQAPGPAELADAALAGHRLDRAWRRLDPQQRELLALHDIEGYSLTELVGMTGLKEGTLKSKLHRARVRLGKLLRLEESRPRAGRIGVIE